MTGGTLPGVVGTNCMTGGPLPKILETAAVETLSKAMLKSTAALEGINMSFPKTMALMWVWMLLVTGTLSLVTGAPEPFLGCVITVLLMGVPLHVLFREDW